MRTNRFVFPAVSTLASLLIGAALAAPAYAVGPTTVPAEVRALQSFETSPVADWDIRAFNLVPPATASWGISGLKFSLGVKSLWCAGTAAGTTYPGGTAGYAQMNLGELSEYYSSALYFKYVMPSLGMSDANSFNVGWSDNGTRVQPNYGFPLTSSWQQRVFDISDPTYLVSISRESGYAYFQFIDFSEGPNQTVKTGQGAFIDEVVVKGYRYGQVRSLSAASAAGVQLSWSAPYASRAHTTIETRPIAYRVWRTLDNGQTPAWVELTAAPGTSATSYLDSSAVAGVSYIYALQVWDNNAQRGYGESLEIVGRRVSPILDLSILAPDAVMKNGSAAITYNVTNTSGAVIGPVSLQDSAGTVLAQIPTIAAGATVSRSFSLGPLASTSSLTATATAGATSVSATRQITVVDPKMTIAVVPSTASVEQGAGFSVDYTVTNTGDIDLKDVVIRNEASATVGQIPSLTTSGPVTLTVNYTAQATRTFSANTTGGWTFLSAGGLVTANAVGATVTVTGVLPPPSRISGATRTATAVELSKEAFPDPLDGDRAVVIASGYGWADALPASALAGVVDGPLLLVAKDSVPAEVATEISRLGAIKAYIVG
ncbi:MAG: cell wall-binding repeat-containing protein, partial [Coriobacteriia bacterium]|nr:cell wall-binding repeat-containing protein [Coriobacteriia bacterium]